MNSSHNKSTDTQIKLITKNNWTSEIGAVKVFPNSCFVFHATSMVACHNWTYHCYMMSLILIRLQFSNFCTLYTDYSPWLKFTQFFFFLLNMTDWRKSFWDNLEVLWLHLNMPLIDWYNSVTSSYSRHRKIVGLYEESLKVYCVILSYVTSANSLTYFKDRTECGSSVRKKPLPIDTPVVHQNQF